MGVSFFLGRPWRTSLNRPGIELSRGCESDNFTRHPIKASDENSYRYGDHGSNVNNSSGSDFLDDG